MEITTKSAQQTQRLGQKLAGSLSRGGVVALYGELGSGKTTFVQGVAAGLGIKKRILSPTFVFVRQYKVSPPRSPFGHLGGGEATTSTPARCNTLYHIDLYRIEKPKDTKELGLEEILSNPANIVLIEWPEKIKEILPQNRIEVFFEHLKVNKQDNQRKVIINHLQ